MDTLFIIISFLAGFRLGQIYFKEQPCSDEVEAVSQDLDYYKSKLIDAESRIDIWKARYNNLVSFQNKMGGRP